MESIMKNIQISLVIILGLLFHGRTHADNNFSAGLGNMPCSEFIELKKLNSLKEPEGPVLGWIQGYLTGVNTVRLQKDLGESIDIPERKNISQRAEGICYKDPASSIVVVAAQIAFDLISQGKTFDVKKAMK